MEITSAQIRQWQARWLPADSISSFEQAVAAVERLGFLWAFSPGPGHLPALFSGLATESEGQRWDWVWGWKDRIAAERVAYYGPVVGQKPTLVSHQALPLFYGLTGNTGDLADDLAHLQESVRLVEVAQKLCRYLEEHGPTGTRTLIAKLTDGSRPAKSALEKALKQLDAGMIIVKSGNEGGNSIANVWDLFARTWPAAVEAGTAIPTREAALHLMRHLFALTPAISQRALASLLPWSADHQERAIAHLLEAGDLLPCTVEGKPGLVARAVVTTLD